MIKDTFVEVDMKHQKVKRKVYQNAYFQGGSCEAAEFTECVFKDVEFEGMWLVDTRFIDCEFESALFYDVQGYEVAFENSSLSSVKFAGCNLARASFHKCEFVGVVFGRDNIGSITDISGADLGEADFGSVQFAGAEYDSDTTFPKLFDPHDYDGLRSSS